jgi:hypothetical protein
VPDDLTPALMPFAVLGAAPAITLKKGIYLRYDFFFEQLFTALRNKGL